jgi:hypothetical protein
MAPNAPGRGVRGAARILLYTVALAVFLGVLKFGWWNHARLERGNVALLRGVTTHDGAAVAGLAVVLGRPTGPWVAIAYRDSHDWWSGASSAVARMSDGRWLRSGRHFCAGLASYQMLQTRLAAGADSGLNADRLAELERDRRGHILFAADEAKTEDEMAAALHAIGFAPMRAP